MPSFPNSSGEAAAAARARVGTTVDGRWRVDALIAVGGSSAIYAASHRNGLRVAMKVLDGELADNATAVNHFLCEGRAVNSIRHPGVVSVLDEGTTSDGAPFLLMPLLEGETAQQRLARHPGGLPAGEALAIVDAVLDVLGAAHARGVVHRDLKPDNVFLERSGAVRVLDFGIAHLANDLDLTQHGTVVGTAGYLPPEQARGSVREAGPRSDVWSVGAMLYTLLTGRVLHEAPTVIASILRAQQEAVPPARALIPGICEPLAHVLDGALAFDARDRWLDAAAMRFAVRAALDEVQRAYGSRATISSCPGVTVEALGGRPGTTSDAPLALEVAHRVRTARKPIAWLAAACVAAAWVLVAAFVSHAGPASRVTSAAGSSHPTAGALGVVSPAPPASAPPVELAPECEAPAAAPSGAPVKVSTAPAPKHGPRKARELVRELDF